MTILQFKIRVHVGRPLSEAGVDKQWVRIAKRLAKCAKGRARYATSQVYADLEAITVCCDEDGKIEFTGKKK